MTVKNKGKYDSFYDKIKDYHLRKLRMLREPNKLKYERDGNYSKEYYRLLKAKKDIKDKIKNRIKEIIDVALIFTEIVRMGEFAQSSRTHNPSLPFHGIDVDPDLSKYELTNDSGSIKYEISNEAQEFVRDVFDEQVIERLLDAIFFHGYNSKAQRINQKHQEYMINVAKKMVNKSVHELEANLDPSLSKIVSQDLRRAVEICNLVGNKIDKNY